MKLTDAVLQYVSRRQEEGAQFIGSQNVLQALCKRTGDISLESLSEGMITAFLTSSQLAPATRSSRQSIINCFLRFWFVRGEAPALRLPKPDRRSITSPPFVYTLGEVRQLLRSTSECQYFCTNLSGHSMRMILLMLYATGARLDEILNLRGTDIDLRRKRIAVAASPYRPGRSIPIGDDLKGALSSYITLHRPSGARSGLLLCYAKGQHVDCRYLESRFRRLVAIAGVDTKTTGRAPHLRDLRLTFAVHRLTHWIRQKADLNVLMPALSTYMGYASLTKAEEFLSYTPERFRYDLRKLSPKKGRRHWRDQPELLRALASL
jgi:integrase/recombinase XerD